jgi:hypothetical protein
VEEEKRRINQLKEVTEGRLQSLSNAADAIEATQRQVRGEIGCLTVLIDAIEATQRQVRGVLRDGTLGAHTSTLHPSSSPPLHLLCTHVYTSPQHTFNFAPSNPSHFTLSSIRSNHALYWTNLRMLRSLWPSRNLFLK